jgi:hypothetical protein
VRSRTFHLRAPDRPKPRAMDTGEALLLLERMHVAALADRHLAAFAVSLAERIRRLHEARQASMEDPPQPVEARGCSNWPPVVLNDRGRIACARRDNRHRRRQTRVWRMPCASHQIDPTPMR